MRYLLLLFEPLIIFAGTAAFMAWMRLVIPDRRGWWRMPAYMAGGMTIALGSMAAMVALGVFVIGPP